VRAPNPRLVDGLNRDLLERCTVSFFRKGWDTLPDIRVVQVADERCVVKDWSRRSWLRRHLQGRFMLRREDGFLRSLRDVSGVPRSHGFPDGDSLAIEYLDGLPLAQVRQCPQDFFDRLEALVRRLHACGIVHGDLDQDDNIMLLADGSPAVIDFGGALRFTSWPVLSAWYEVLRRHDLQCVADLRGRFEPSAGAQPSTLLPWQRRLLRFFNKVDRPSPVRRHGVGKAP
jgi:RIO-like serine/threonine protein kinase